MEQILTIVAPVFGLILAGWIAIKVGYLQIGSHRVLAEFAFKIAMPALLFRAMLSIGEMPGDPLRLIAAYFGAGVLVWIAATLVTVVVLRRPAVDSASIAMGATFGNTVMLGLPLALAAFGPEAAAPAALLISLDSPVLWIAATLQIEALRPGRQGSLVVSLGSVLWDLVRNPIITSLIAGTLFRLAGLSLPPPVDKGLAMLQGAAVPAALVALGMSLATYELRGQAASLSAICILKLVLFPVAAYLLAVEVLALPPLWTAITVLFAAMPVGANAYLFAARYDSAVGSVSSAIAVSTAIAVASVSALLYWLTATTP